MRQLDFSSLQTTAPLLGDSSGFSGGFPGDFSAAPSFEVPITDDVSFRMLV